MTNPRTESNGWFDQGALVGRWVGPGYPYVEGVALAALGHPRATLPPSDLSYDTLAKYELWAYGLEWGNGFFTPYDDWIRTIRDEEGKNQCRQYILWAFEVGFQTAAVGQPRQPAPAFETWPTARLMAWREGYDAAKSLGFTYDIRSLHKALAWLRRRAAMPVLERVATFLAALTPPVLPSEVVDYSALREPHAVEWHPFAEQQEYRVSTRAPRRSVATAEADTTPDLAPLVAGVDSILARLDDPIPERGNSELFTLRRMVKRAAFLSNRLKDNQALLAAMDQEEAALRVGNLSLDQKRLYVSLARRRSSIQGQVTKDTNEQAGLVKIIAKLDGDASDRRQALLAEAQARQERLKQRAAELEMERLETWGALQALKPGPGTARQDSRLRDKLERIALTNQLVAEHQRLGRLFIQTLQEGPIYLSFRPDDLSFRPDDVVARVQARVKDIRDVRKTMRKLDAFKGDRATASQRSGADLLVRGLMLRLCAIQEDELDLLHNLLLDRLDTLPETSNTLRVMPATRSGLARLNQEVSMWTAYGRALADVLLPLASSTISAIGPSARSLDPSTREALGKFAARRLEYERLLDRSETALKGAELERQEYLKEALEEAAQQARAQAVFYTVAMGPFEPMRVKALSRQEMQDVLKRATRIINGRVITDEAVLDVEMVYQATLANDNRMTRAALMQFKENYPEDWERVVSVVIGETLKTPGVLRTATPQPR